MLFRSWVGMSDSDSGAAVAAGEVSEAEETSYIFKKVTNPASTTRHTIAKDARSKGIVEPFFINCGSFPVYIR